MIARYLACENYVEVCKDPTDGITIKDVFQITNSMDNPQRNERAAHGAQQNFDA